MIYKPLFSPQKIVEALCGKPVCQTINQCFENWGLPQCIKIDNGVPLANRDKRELPTLTQLWWIGLGIEVHLNNFNRPQQNGTVEGLQGIGYRWSAPHLYDSLEAYQARINETALFQRENFRIRRFGDKTRKELYPELWENPRRYSPSNFNIQKVYDNLSKRVWKRTINGAGQFRFWTMRFYIGKAFIGQPVTITFDPIEIQWMIRNLKGELLKLKTLMPFTENDILDYAGISKNL